MERIDLYIRPPVAGRHLGHYKAALQDTELLIGYSRMINMIPVTNGFSPSRWQQATSVMLEKDKGDPKIHRLCIIHLFEANYNLFFKLIWGFHMVGRAEDRGLFGEDMQGSRKHRSTLDVLFKKTLSFDIARQQRSNLAIFENDAESCYDRILVNIAMLSARILGVPTGAILAHSETVRLMKYNIKTIYGTSEARYQGTDQEQLLAGTGQGSGVSPAVWLSICIPLVLAYTKHAPRGMKYSDPTGMVISERYADAFVDDTSLGFNDDPKERMNIIATMLETLTKCAQLWE